ncbi:MAG: hypothetical protein M0P69_13850 [Bacteroidales bacterium]|nr:hypothetical protein [Bacteroidales bacterium]
MFTSEGRFPVTITEALLTEAKFNETDQNAFDVCLHVETEDGQSGDWTGEISNNYGMGTMSDKRQSEITLITLKKLGWNHGLDFSKIEELVGVKTTATTKASTTGDNKTYYNVRYLGDGNRKTKLNANDIAKRVAALNSGAASSDVQDADEVDLDPTSVF